MTRDSVRIDKLIRSRRRSVALQIEKDATLVVRMPHWLRESEVLKIVERKRSWIQTQQDKARERQRLAPKRNFTEGEAFLFLGKEYPLHFVEALGSPVVFENAFYVDARLRGAAKRVLEKWYRWQARLFLEERSAFFSNMAGQPYRKLRISGARTRWGSCSSGGTLSYTWRLIMAPQGAVDYVAAHEVAHLKFKNHGPLFWKKVQEMYPDYAVWKQWLDENDFLLHY